MKSLDDSNQKVLTQIGYNIDFTNDMFVQLATTLYFDNDINILMKRDDFTSYDLLSGLHNLDKIVQATSYLNSIIVYNGKTDMIYSGGDYNLRNNDSNMTSRFRELLSGRGNTRNLMLVPISYMDNTDKTSEKHVFSMLIYESSGSHRSRENALILNINSDWLFKNLVRLNQVGRNYNSMVFIMDGQGNIFNPSDTQTNRFVEWKTIIQNHFADFQAKSGSILINDKNGKYIGTHLKLDSVDWQLITFQSFDEFIIPIKQLQTSSIIFVSIFLILAVIVVFISSHKLYKPVEQLVQQIRTYAQGDFGTSQSKNELTDITNSYKTVVNKLNTMQDAYNYKKDIVKNYYLQKLIMDSSSIPEAEFQESINQYHLKLDARGPYILLMIKLDENSMMHADDSDRKLLQFAAVNIVKESLGNQYHLELIETNSNQIVVILNSTADLALVTAEAAANIIETQAIIFKYYRITFTVSISEVFINYQDMAANFVKVQQYLTYRLIYGKGSIITAEMVPADKMSIDHHFIDDTENKMIESIHANNFPQYKERVNQYFHYLKKLDIGSIDYYLTQLIVKLIVVIKKLNKLPNFPLSIGAEGLTQKITQMETLDEIEEAMLDVVRGAREEQTNTDVHKYVLMADTVKDIIHQQYMDPNLSLQHISSLMKMSPTYIGRIFKNYKSISVADYINEVRLDLALELLENGDFTIKEIMDKTGYSSQSNFFRLFKIKYGAPPKEYRLKKLMDKYNI